MSNPNLKTLAIFFDIQKIAKPAYGLDAWGIFWRIRKPSDLPPGTLLYSGDVTRQGGVDYVIALETHSDDVVDKLEKEFLADAVADGANGIQN